MSLDFADRIHTIDSSPIRKAFDMAKKIQNPINLSIGQPHFPCPENILNAMKRALDSGHTSYTLTSGIPELKQAIAEKYKIFNKISTAKEENILITSGISSALFLLFNTLVNPGDECLVITPYFLMYPSMLGFHGAKVHFLNEDFTESDVKKFENHKFKLIIFSNPSNPTGKILSKDQLQLLAILAEKTKSYLVSDEIYELFDYDQKFVSPASFYEKTITLSGFSKTYSMTGLRLASILAESDVIQNLTKLQQYTVVCAPAPTQWAGIEALKTDMSSYIADYKEKRDFVYEELKTHFDIQKSDGAFYYFLKIQGNDEEFIKRAIEEKKLLLVPGFIFTQDHNHVRLSFASTWENLKLGIAALKELV